MQNHLPCFIKILCIVFFHYTDYFEPPCQTDADCEPAWNEYFVCKCIDLKCKWIFAERPIKPEVPKVPL
jgi:hypothetical protein